MNKIPTAEEFLNDQGVPLDKLQNLPWFDYGNILTWLEEYSNLKTKHHVKAALRAAADSAQTKTTSCYTNASGNEKGELYEDVEIIDEDSILNAYPENLII